MDNDFPKHVFWHWQIGSENQDEILNAWFSGQQPKEGATYGLNLVRVRRGGVTDLTFQLVEIAPPPAIEDRFEQSPQG